MILEHAKVKKFKVETQLLVTREYWEDEVEERDIRPNFFRELSLFQSQMIPGQPHLGVQFVRDKKYKEYVV